MDSNVSSTVLGVGFIGGVLVFHKYPVLYFSVLDASSVEMVSTIGVGAILAQGMAVTVKFSHRRIQATWLATLGVLRT